jgi:hypothetical protein
VANGAIVANTKSRKKEVVPGNLLFYEGDVLSQGIYDVVAFPQLKVKLDQMNELIAKNPLDPAGLTERGELNLYNRKWQAAVDDLRQALASKPLPETAVKARDKLYETLKEYLYQKFDDAEKYLDEYRELCKVQVDPTAPQGERLKAEQQQQQRTATYYFLLAQGREHQGKLLDALDAYLQFAAAGAEIPELQDIIGERSPRAKPEIVARGKIESMARRATEEQRKPLEERVTREYAEISKVGSDPEALRRFVSLFGLEFKLGRDARLQMAEQLLDEEGTANLLEAERQLLLLRYQEDSPQLAAQAVEALARLMARKGLNGMEDAAFYYRVLGTEFSNVPVRDGKTGRDLLEELPTDKRFLPYLDEPGQGGNVPTNIKAKEESGNFQPTKTQYQFEPDGEVLPFFQRHRVVLDMTNGHDFKLIDRLTGEEKVKLPLTKTLFSNFLWANGNAASPRYTFQTVGHLVVLPLGHMVFAIDTVNKKLLWERNLIGPNITPQNPNVTIDPRDNTVVLIYPDGYVQRLGQAGPVKASYVCLQMRDGLTALDPMTGATLWKQEDIKPTSYVFGDDHHIFIVEMNQEGKPSGTRALRAEDGAPVTVPDFKALFMQRQAILQGNRLLVWDQGANPALRIYDVLTGKDVWKKELPAGSLPLHCEQPNLAGVVESNGRVTVFDLRTQKTLLQAEVETKFLDKVQNVSLMQDRTHFYVFINGPQDNTANPFGGPWSNFQPTTGIRSLPVNGMVYGFDRETGKRWRSTDPIQQLLVLDQFEDLPILLFTSRYQRMMGAGVNRWMVNGASVKAIDKRNGKLIYDKPELNLNNAQQFHAFKVDHQKGTIELTSYNFRLTFNLEHGAIAADAAPPTPPKP